MRNKNFSIDGIFIGILYSLLVFFLSVYYANISGLLAPFFEAIYIPEGKRTFFVTSLLLFLSIIIFFISSKKNFILKQLILLLSAWLPFLLYLTVRCDFGYPYSIKKLGLLIIANVLPLFAICVAYLNDNERFEKHFFSITFTMASIVLLILFLKPEEFIYASRVTRLTVENTNPVWLARTFSIGALCALILLDKYKLVGFFVWAIFIIGIFLTGSRGPFFAILITTAIYFFAKIKSIKNILFSFVFMTVIVSFAIGSYKYYISDFSKYLSRDSKENFFSESGRLDGLHRSFKEFSYFPLTGHGLGKYGTPIEKEVSKQRRLNDKVARNYPHNIIAEILAELGIIGFILFLISLRIGKWTFNFINKFVLLFLVSFLFSLTSGDITGNHGVFFFGLIAKLSDINYSQET